jgi:uncharacterized protein
MKTAVTLIMMATSLLLATSLPAQLAMDGSRRAKAPDGWTKFAWPEMKAVLFGQYAPTEEESELINKAMPAKATVQPGKPRKILLFYRCEYPHASIATGVLTFQKMAETTRAFEVVVTDDPEDFKLDRLAKFDAVMLVNTVGFDQLIGPDGRAALLQFVQSGKGLIGIHAASDSCKQWKEGQPLFNGVFDCHPWLPKGNWAFQLESPDHPLNQCFGGVGFWLRDEIYQYRIGSHSRESSRVLLSLDMSQSGNFNGPELHDKLKNRIDPHGKYDVTWIHQFGDGRVFYSNLGHNNTTYWQPTVLKHYLNGIQYALGDLPADATPSSTLQTTIVAPAPPRRAQTNANPIRPH